MRPNRPNHRCDRIALLLLGLAVLTSCGGDGPDSEDRRTQPYSGIEPGAIIELQGADPAWSGRLEADSLALDLDESETIISVERFAGNNGLGVTGGAGERALVLTVTPGTCRVAPGATIAPFTATLAIGDDTRFGCARIVR